MSRAENFEQGSGLPDVVSYDKYLIQDDWVGTGVSAHTYSDKKWNGIGKRIGTLTWYPGEVRKKEDGSYDDSSNVNGGVIHGVHVSTQFRRKGLASAMLDYARTKHPEREIRHSNLLSDDGRSWAEKHP
jgi:GNAT superfamily N-acetyltransferase